MAKIFTTVEEALRKLDISMDPDPDAVYDRLSAALTKAEMVITYETSDEPVPMNMIRDGIMEVIEQYHVDKTNFPQPWKSLDDPYDTYLDLDLLHQDDHFQALTSEAYDLDQYPNSAMGHLDILSDEALHALLEELMTDMESYPVYVWDDHPHYPRVMREEDFWDRVERAREQAA